MVANLFFVLGLSMSDDVGNQIEEDIFEKFRSEDQLGPIMTLLHNIKDII